MSRAVRVALRPLRAEDRDRLRTWRNLPEIARWMYSDHEISAAEHARWFAGALADQGRRYWIIEMDGEPAYVESPFVNQLKTLPVRLGPRAT